MSRPAPLPDGLGDILDALPAGVTLIDPQLAAPPRRRACHIPGRVLII